MTFDYDSPSVPATAVADVVADISSAGKLPPLSDEERKQRRVANELYRWQRQQHEEERAFEYRERQAEAEAVARAEAAAEIAENNRQVRLAQQERDRERQRERQISDLHFRARQAEIWQQNVDQAAYNAVQQRYRQTLMGELDALVNAPQPQPEPEPETVYVEAAEGSDELGTSDFSPKLWMQKSRRWW